MKQLHFDCSMGAAGDMLTAALLELVPDRENVLERLNHLGIPGVHFEAETAQKCGITGTHMHVTWNGTEELPGHHHHHHDHDHEHHHGHEHEHEHHHHSGVHEISHVISHLNLPENVRKDAAAVFNRIAEAESQVHGVPVDQIHFHEVGTMDAVADVVAVCLLMDLVKPDAVTATPIHVGSGTVRCAHGILPVPAPATALLLKEVPIYSGDIRGELCTPTGAALLTHFVSKFGPMPALTPKAIGYGLGTKDFPQANCVRAILGETEESEQDILELSCNLDDMTPEAIGFAMEQLYHAGALEVYTTAVGMKKNRPGVILSALCRPEGRESIVQTMFRHTTTLGIREQTFRRYTLSRSFETVETPFGAVRKKISTGYGVTREKYEYDDLQKIATENGLSISEVLKKLG